MTKNSNTIKELTLFDEMEKPKAISLFSGAGGLDMGAILAGAEIVWANDMMKEACETYKKNIGSHIICGDINRLIPSLANFPDIDMVIGGPPCQGFSVAGKMDASDMRSKLVWSYADVISVVRPKAFIMENVKALADLDKWKDVRTRLLIRLRSLGYSTNLIVLNASEFDVPQSRERMFVVGFKGDSDLLPDLETMIKPYRKKAPSVRKALSVLDRAGSGNNQTVCNAKITLAKKPVLRKTPYAGMIFNGLGRPLRIDGYSATLPASMGGNKTPIIDEEELYNNAKPWVEEYFSKLLADSQLPSKTVIPGRMRRLTVEEAALLQTFPIGYKFCGTQSKIYTQIGNAVPCNLGKAVVKMVIDVLLGVTRIKYTDKII